MPQGINVQQLRQQAYNEVRMLDIAGKLGASTYRSLVNKCLLARSPKLIAIRDQAKQFRQNAAVRKVTLNNFVITQPQREAAAAQEALQLFQFELPQIETPPVEITANYNVETVFYKNYEVKNNKFDMRMVFLNLTRPTANIARVRQYIVDYFRSRINQFVGKRLSVRLSFKEVGYRYGTGEVVVNTENDFQNLLDERMITKWISDRQNYEESEGWLVDRVRYTVTMNAGGCFEIDCSIAGFSDRDLKEKIYIPLNKGDTNCVLYCAEYLSNAGETKTGKVGKVSGLKEIAKICAEKRKELYGEGKGLIESDKLMPIAKSYKFNINVWMCDGWKFHSVNQYYVDGSRTMNLLLHNKHYSLILNPKLTQYERCRTCLKFYANLADHSQKCQKCRKCGATYTGEHTAEECKFNQNHLHTNKNERHVLVSKVAKKFNAIENVIYCDFETLVKSDDEGRKHRIYASAYAIDQGDVVVHEGEDSLKKFVDDMLTLNRGRKQFTMVFYNGSRFDLYFVYKELQKRNVEVSNLIHSDGGYKSFKFGNITTFDLNLHLVGSLASNCDAFGVAGDKKKGDFNHTLMKDWSDVAKYRDDWLPYLRLDIASMREVYVKYAESVWSDFQMNINDFITLSSLAFKIWRTKLTQKIPLLDYQTDCWVRKASYGGRCFPQKQFFESKDHETDYLVDIDVVSLYPTAMAQYVYPIGEHKEELREPTLAYWCDLMNGLQVRPFKLAIMECDITPNKRLVSPVLPRRENGKLYWDLHDIKHGVYTTVDLERAIRHGYKITKIHRAISWRESGDVFADYITKVFKMKQNAKKDTPQYSVAKLMMNSLFGKMLQAPITQKSKVVSTLEELNKVRSDNKVLDFDFLGEEKLFVSYEPYELDETVTKPTYLGAFILSYSRLIMDKYVDAIDGYNNMDTTFYRTDTDSLIIHARELEKVKQYIGKNLGDIDFDIKGKIVQFGEVCPKVYVCNYVKEDGSIGKHVRAKGFDKKSQEQLAFDDIKRMLFGCDTKEAITLYDKWGGEHGCITKEGDKVRLQLDSKIKRIAFKVNSKQRELGYEYSEIVNVKFDRCLNKTIWKKRQHIEGHPEMASLPFGHEQ